MVNDKFNKFEKLFFNPFDYITRQYYNENQFIPVKTYGVIFLIFSP